MAPDLTKAMIAAALAKADARICSNVDAARATCIPKGRCKVGSVGSRGGRESFDVWLEVSTGLVKLIPQVNA